MYAERTAKLQQKLGAENLDALLVTSLPNIFYLTGFNGSTAMVLLTPDARYFLTDFRYHTQFETQVDKSYTLVDNTAKSFADKVLPSLPDSASIKRIGFEAQHVNFATYDKFSETAGREFLPTMSWVEELRACKDAAELEIIRESILLNERIWQEVLGKVADGVTEADLAAEINFLALKYGASGVSFRPIVASGTNSAKPHAGFSMQTMVPDTPLTFDMGVLLKGYASDMTRTVFFKSCPQKWEDIYNIVREAKDKAAEAIKPGAIGKDVDAVARNVISDAGYGDKFGHGLGHGVGIEVHEAPRLAQVSESELKPGMVVTNEPGIYLPGEGGIRIEDIFVLTESGCENYNTLPTDIQVVG